MILIALGILGVMQSGAINAQWEAMYPRDAAKQDAITRCTQDNPNFNRFSGPARAQCYQKYLNLPADAPFAVAPNPATGGNNSNQR